MILNNYYLLRAITEVIRSASTITVEGEVE